jgi:hypothetical protein
MSPEEAVRAFFDCYTDGRPEDFIRYAIDALVADGDMVAAAWTGSLPGGAEMRGLSLYRVTGGLLRSTRHELIGGLPV